MVKMKWKMIGQCKEQHLSSLSVIVCPRVDIGMRARSFLFFCLHLHRILSNWNTNLGFHFMLSFEKARGIMNVERKFHIYNPSNIHLYPSKAFFLHEPYFFDIFDDFCYLISYLLKFCRKLFKLICSPCKIISHLEILWVFRFWVLTGSKNTERHKQKF